jgi:signal transduction histidine kinase
MKVTPALKNELAQWLDTYWTTYLKGDIETWATFLRDDYRNIGGTKEEIWNSKQEIIDYTLKIMDQMLGTVEIRNREIEVIPYGEYMMVNEFTDLHVKAEGEWILYGPFRMSSLLEKTDTSWLALHQHGSYPDMKAMEGEAFSMDSLKAENAKLQEAVKRRTTELENKNRDLEIEAALERARAQSMVMQHSGEINSISSTFHHQLILLGIPSEFSYVWLPDEENQSHQFWASWSEVKAGENTLQSKQVTYPLDKSEPYTAACYAAWANPDVIHEEFIPPRDIDGFFEVWQELLSGAEKLKADHFREGIYYSEAYMRYGCFGINIRRKLSEEEKNILKRFSKEFERTYTRFLDLQKAEAQAKEAQIELSLERIRSQVTAMQESSDLLEIVVTMRTEFVNLGHEAHYFWHMRWLSERYDKAMTSGDGTKIGMVMTLPRHIHGDIPPVADWEKTKEPTVVLAMDIETAVDYVHKMITLGDFEQVDPQAPTLDDIRHIGGLTFIMARTTHGEIGYSLPGVVPSPPKEAVDTLVRFASVFDLAYKRFEDLKSAERQHREAQIELALERVRARTMAMQHSDELADASHVLDEQVRALGIETWGCAFHIYADNADGDYEWFSSANGNLPFYKTPREKFFLRFYEKGQRGETFHIEEFAGEDCKAHYDFLKTLPVAGDALKALEESGIPLPDYQIDHIAFFSHGYILFITYEPVPEAHEIFRRFARVFEQTYTRFIDLQKLEAQALRAENDLIAIKAARHKAEDALTELKATQSQLIQQEKLASLGQLTAGIAHEIKNPLNFVNNFSNVSLEMIDEALEELLKEERRKKKEEGDPDLDLVLEILSDIKINLTKIHEHGSRADGIVKSMLQHSRGGSGKMEPTDLNALVKEFANLAYHGMRAGKDPIEAEVTIDLDDSIGQVPLVYEDFSRVILNICSNAFDAMRGSGIGDQGSATTPKASNFINSGAVIPEGPSLKVTGGAVIPNEVRDRPQVTGGGHSHLQVRTRRSGDRIVIEIEDNGPGIPDDIKDKILQPFFTTKKGTQGTGLGLSITHDIVKAHGGALSINSELGNGSTFIISLQLS